MFLFIGEFVHLKEVKQSGHIVNLSVMSSETSIKLLRIDLLCSKSSAIHTYDVLDLYSNKVSQAISFPEKNRSFYEIHKLASIYLSNTGFDWASPAKRNLLMKCCDRREDALEQYEEMKPMLLEEARTLLEKEARILKAEIRADFESIIYNSNIYPQIERLVSYLLINKYLRRWFYKYLQTEPRDVLKVFYDKIKIISYPRDNVLFEPLKDLAFYLSGVLDIDSNKKSKFIF